MWIANLYFLKDMLVCQPDHLLDDADSAGKKIGVERAERSSYLFRSLSAGGAHLAFGSDWPVCISRNLCSV
jgi:predicted amidohydrolase YtcJ